MSKEEIFTYTTNQRHLRDCQRRINGLTISVNMGEPYQAELKRHLAARDEILTRLTEKEIADMKAHENRGLTPEEQAAAAKAIASAMSENRDKPSI